MGGSKITTDIATPVEADVGVYTITVTQDITGYETRTSSMDYTVTVTSPCSTTSFTAQTISDKYEFISDFALSLP